MRQGEQVLYITLIDFLLQLLFVGVVVSVIYTLSQPGSDEKVDLVEFKDNVKKLTGISDLTEITDELTRLGPLREVEKKLATSKGFNELSTKLGGAEAALKILSIEAGKGTAPGKPWCLNGRSIAVFDAYLDRIELRAPLSPEMSDLIKNLKINLENYQSVPISEFYKIFGPIKNFEKDCVFNVTFIEHSYNTRPRDAAYSVFKLSLQKSPDIK